MNYQEPTVEELTQARCFRLFRHWFQEGRAMPYYEMGEGQRHLHWLLGGLLSNGESRHAPALQAGAQRVMRMLLGEHGWTVYLALLARRQADGDMVRD